MQENLSFWQIRLIITQAPEIFEVDKAPNDTIPFYQKPEHIRSFLYDPFGGNPPSTYGIELTANRNIDFTFFTKVESKLEGIKLGTAWLSNLRYKFLGLNGNVEVKQIESNIEDEKGKCKFYEIVLPTGLIKNKINIIDRFVNLFYNNNQSVKLWILWRRGSQSTKSEDQPNYYYLRIFTTYSPEILTNKDQLRIKGILEFLSMDIENDKGERAFVQEYSKISRENLLKGDVFDNEQDDLKIFTIEDVNFDFPEDLPLPKIPRLENENVRYIDLNKEFIRESIGIGNHIKNRIITNHNTYIPINKLPQDLCIFGL